MKNEAEKIQLRISQRLKKMERLAVNTDDIKFLWHWSHKLYEHATALEAKEKCYENKLHQVKEFLKNLS